MGRRASAVCALIVAAAALAACSNDAKVIPAGTMSEIYADMLLADQWILDHAKERRVADTTLFYEPIFRKYGYTTADYQKSLHRYLGRPEKFDKIVTRANEKLEERKKCLENQQSLDQSKPED